MLDIKDIPTTSIDVKKATHFAGVKLPRVGVKKRDPIDDVPPPEIKKRGVVIDGIKFASQKEAAAHFGISRSTISHHIRSGTVGKIKSVGSGENHRSSATPVTIRGGEYPSVYAAARDLGISKATLYGHIRNGTTDRAGLGHKGLKYKQRNKT